MIPSVYGLTCKIPKQHINTKLKPQIVAFPISTKYSTSLPSPVFINQTFQRVQLTKNELRVKSIINGVATITLKIKKLTANITLNIKDPF